MLRVTVGALVVATVLSVVLAVDPWLPAGSVHSALERLCGSASCSSLDDFPLLRLPWGSVRVPLSFMSVLYFSVLLAWLACVGPANHMARYWHLAPALLVVLGFAGSVWLVFVMIGMGIPCWRCITLHLLNVVAGAGILLLWPRRAAVPATTASPASRTSLLAELRHPDAQPPFRIALSGVAIVLLLVALETVGYAHLVANATLRDLRQVVAFYESNAAVGEALYRSEPVHHIATREDAPEMPCTGCRHELIVFSDYRCHSCRAFHRFLDETIVPLAKGRLKVVFQFYPLPPAKRTTDSLDTPGWREARFAEAIRELGGNDRFLRIHRELMLRKDLRKEAALAEMAASVGLDSAQVEARMRSAETVGRIREDMKNLQEAGVVTVPAPFLDGRLVRHWENRGFWETILR